MDSKEEVGNITHLDFLDVHGQHSGRLVETSPAGTTIQHRRQITLQEGGRERNDIASKKATLQ